jgi:uncharacterized membrane protein
MSNLIAKVAPTALLASAAFAQGLSFTPLGDLPGGAFASRANAVAADGSAIAGQGDTGATDAVLWIRSGSTWSGPFALPRLAGGTGGIARGVADSGSVVVGESTVANFRQPVRWNVVGTSGTIASIPFPADGGYSGVAYACSANGSVICGDILFAPPSGGGPPPLPITKAIRNTSAGTIDLGTVTGAPGVSAGVTTARAISSNGSVSVGYGMDASSTYRPFRHAGTMNDLTGGAWSGFGRGCSPDGNTIVGSQTIGGATAAFIWTSAGGHVPLAPLPTFDSAAALDATNNGRRVCGLNLLTGISNSQHAVIWDEGLGCRSIAQVLSAGGADLSGWNLTFATSMSDDGTTIVGYGINPSGNTEAWIATIPMPPVACPADLDNGSGTGTPDGGVDVNDLLYFLVQFEAGAATADLDNGSGSGTPDGGVDINDLLFFLAHFEAGC